MCSLKWTIFRREDIDYWLNNLERESKISDYTLTGPQIEYIWDHFEGSIWEISTLLGQFLRVCRNGKIEDTEMKRIIERFIRQAVSYFEGYAGVKKHKEALLCEIRKHCSKGCFKERELISVVENGFFNEDLLRDELNEMVRQNFLYYNPTLAEYKLQGKSMVLGLEAYVEMVENRRRG